MASSEPTANGYEISGGGDDQKKDANAAPANAKELADMKEAAIVYRWIDKIPLSRPKRSISRDFSDGVLMSEVVNHFFPKLIDLHNYAKTNAIATKRYNWETLNSKVFKKMGFQLGGDDVKAVVDAERGAIEKVLRFVQIRMAEYQKKVERNRETEKQRESQAEAEAAAAAAREEAEAAAAAAAEAKAAAAAAAEAKAAAAPKGTGAAPAVAAKKPVAGGSKAPTHAKSASTSGGSPSAAAAAARRKTGGALPAASSSAANEKDMNDLRETVDILQLKVDKLEQLLKLKNTKIAALQSQVEQLTAAK